MRCVAILNTERPGLDTVIVWQDNTGRLIAFAYLDGQVKMTRPLTAATFDEGVAEVQIGFQLGTGQVTRITDWANIAAPTRTSPAASTRWGFNP